MNSCLSQAVIDRYVKGACSAPEKTRVQDHIQQCAVCRGHVEQALPTVPASDPSGRGSDRTEGKDMPGVSNVGFIDTITQKALEPLFENYQILEELPRGGQAVVYKAIHKPTKRKVALKVLLPTYMGSAKARRHFEREVELAAGLDHPNIVTILDSGVSRGQYYFSMEFVRGRCLDEYVENDNLTLRQKIALFKHICDAMTHAHQHGVIHRDLKPSNILVDERGEPRIVDFGLAKSALPDNVSMMSISGEIKGTVNYMSPEQAEGRADLVDVRSDVYALGVILYRLLLGQFPYDVSQSTLEVLQTIKHVDPIRPRSLIQRFDSDVEAILLKALAKDRSLRYQSAAELNHDLGCWLEGLPIVAKSVSSLYLLKKVIGRHRYTSTVAGLLAVIVISFAYVSGYLYWDMRQARREIHSVEALWRQDSAMKVQQDQERAFADFLHYWWDDNTEGMHFVAGFLGSETAIKKAMVFLADPNDPDGKAQAFREQMDEQDQWFADYCMAEDYLKRGRQLKAYALYQRSHAKLLERSPGPQSGFARFIENHIKARLWDLSREN